MRMPVLEKRLPLTDEEYLGLGETSERIELFDGSLYLSSKSSPRHQRMVGQLIDALQPGARKARLHAVGAVNTRLQARRIVIPDLVVAAIADFDRPVVEAREVVLVTRIGEVLRLTGPPAATITPAALLPPA